MASSSGLRRSEDDCCSTCHQLEQPRRKLWLCISCDILYCDFCWPQVRAHDATGITWRGNGHEKIDPMIQRRLDQVFHPRYTDEQLDELHKADEGTTWFGVGKERNGGAFLTDGGVYEALTLRSAIDNQARYPQIASLVGETNAGKSTLIKMLIEFAEYRHRPGEVFGFPSPIVGPREASDPTSVDVHMYADPDTFGSTVPLFYADCEGLAGGEQIPRGGRRTGLTGGNMWPLKWANTPERCRRKYTVSELYPRLLYTFSDMVVFVTANRRAFEERGLLPLLKWAHTSLEKSINQATLPHLIVVNNVVPDSNSSSSWQVSVATNQLLHNVRDSINAIPAVRKYAEFWRSRGGNIQSTRDLILCYYSSIRVVNIPPEEHGTGLMIRQLNTLREEIKTAAESSHASKSEVRMLSTSSELGIFMQAAYDHFSRTLKRPFNFIDISLKFNPIPTRFGGNMLQLANAILGEDFDSRWLFDQLSKLIASCVLLDCVRTGRKGDPVAHMKKYHLSLDDMLKQFCLRHEPCDYSNERDFCVISRASHTKGHQNGRGKIFAAGKYRSRFTYEKYRDRWERKLHEQITAATENFNRARDVAQGCGGTTSNGPATLTALGSTSSESLTETEQSIVMESHSDTLISFYRNTEQIDSFRSHRACVCCFIHTPQHVLPCGHALCTTCVKIWAHEKRECSVVLRDCPLHPEQTEWMEEFSIGFKPELAGVRILSLDGGGIRGIVELEILGAIQAGLGAPNGRKIPIQAFLDLVVGTSTGGLIAIAIGAKQWDVSRALETFRNLANAAFTPREFHGVPILEQLAIFYHSSKYKTRPLYDALRVSFGESSFFGYQKDSPSAYDVKVAVTSANEDATRPLVLSNYNRPEPGSTDSDMKNDDAAPYDFIRPNLPSQELATWQAGAAGAAAIPYFKPFFHEASLRHFLDGGFYHNNPSKVATRESELLWPDLQGQLPDIFISIGTSQNKREIDSELKKVHDCETRHPKQSSRRDFRPFPDSRQYLSSLKGRIDNIFDSQKAWCDFVDTVVDKNRYIRLNPDVRREPPKLDEVGEMQGLGEIIKQRIKEEPLRLHVQRAAQMLMASAFYFRVESRVALTATAEPTFDVVGKIACRFEERPIDLQDLGQYLQSQRRRNFRPYFVIRTADDRILQRRKISSAVTGAMIADSSWNMPSIELNAITHTTIIHISVYLDQTEDAFPISGFPRPVTSATPWEVSRSPSPVVTRAELPNHSRRRTVAEFPAMSTPRMSRVTAHRSVTHPEPLSRGRSEMPGAETSSRPSQALDGSLMLSELPGDMPSAELPTRSSTTRDPVPAPGPSSRSHSTSRREFAPTQPAGERGTSRPDTTERRHSRNPPGDRGGASRPNTSEGRHTRNPSRGERATSRPSTSERHHSRNPSGSGRNGQVRNESSRRNRSDQDPQPDTRDNSSSRSNSHSNDTIERILARPEVSRRRRTHPEGTSHPPTSMHTQRPITSIARTIPPPQLSLPSQLHAQRPTSSTAHQIPPSLATAIPLLPRTQPASPPSRLRPPDPGPPHVPRHSRPGIEASTRNIAAAAAATLYRQVNNFSSLDSLVTNTTSPVPRFIQNVSPALSGLSSLSDLSIVSDEELEDPPAPGETRSRVMRSVSDIDQEW